VALVALEALIGIAILPRATRRYAAVAGFVFAVGIWLFCQSAGALTTGDRSQLRTAHRRHGRRRVQHPRASGDLCLERTQGRDSDARARLLTRRTYPN
jgi:hypothetical protein